MNAPAERLAGVVLAAGGSTRLGHPKQLVEWHGQPLVRHSVELALGACEAGVVVVTGAGAEEVTEALASLDVKCLRNENWAAGMSTSLRQGLDHLPDQAGSVLPMLCDQPRIDDQDLAKLRAAWRKWPDQPAAAAYADAIGVPAIVPLDLCSELAAALSGDAGAGQWLRNRDDLNLVDMPNAAYDVDTDEDLQQLSAD